jgi:phosphoglucomutase
MDSSSAVFSEVSELLIEKFGDLGSAASGHLAKWINGDLPFTYPDILEKHLTNETVDLLFDAFWQVLPFGTGGRRGRIGYGSNRINPTTIAVTVQGHCDYLHTVAQGHKALSVVVANDVRVFNDLAGTYRFLGPTHPLLGISSRQLGRLACEVYAANGIVAYFAQPENDMAVLTTPELSYIISHLGAAGGVNISASHNPPDDNGIKMYDEYGSQPIAPDDQHLVEIMDRVEKVSRMPFEQAVEAQLIRGVPPELHVNYIGTYLSLFGETNVVDQTSPIVYTPLCGCGLTTVGEVLSTLRFPMLVPPHQGPDGTFGVIPFRAPNPEVPQATEPAKEFADRMNSGIVLSSDPDADRVGLEVKLPSGSWHHCDGNQIAAILSYYLMLDPEGPKRKGLVLETLVTTRIMGKIVERAGDSLIIDNLLVGFKYVANVLKKIRASGSYNGIHCSPDKLVIAAEESHGVIIVPAILDKDAVPACMYLAVLYQRLRREGRTLLDYYVKILDDVGPYADTSRSIMMTGAEGIFKRDHIMESLRKNPLSVVDGYSFVRTVDHWDTETFGAFVSETDRLPRNVLQFVFDTLMITVRPSGTEPKLKVYCQVMPDPELLKTHGYERHDAVVKKAELVALAIYKQLLARIDVHLDVPSLLLPDIVDLDRKVHFQTRTIPALHSAIERDRFRNLEGVLDWLRDEAAPMTPGADPIPALKAPIEYLCHQWSDTGTRSALLSNLLQWAQGEVV